MAREISGGWPGLTPQSDRDLGEPKHENEAPATHATVVSLASATFLILYGRVAATLQAPSEDIIGKWRKRKSAFEERLGRTIG